MFRTRTQKITFEEAEEYIRTSQLDRLGRSLAQEERYSRQNARLKDEWASICDFILHDKFSIVSFTHSLYSDVFVADLTYDSPCLSQDFVEEGGFKAVPRPLPTLSSDQSIRLARNDHPYFFEDGMEHWVLWKLGFLAVREDEIVTATQQLQKESDVQRWTWFQNPPALMSIPEIQHAHIIVLREAKRGNQRCA